ncbi:hypothetical protein [Paenibacillus sp. USHLN196]
MNLIDPELKYIDCLVDLNPNKVGNYIPGMLACNNNL